MSEARFRQRMLKFTNWVEGAILSTLDKKMRDELRDEYRKNRDIALEGDDPKPKAPRTLLVEELKSRADIERIFRPHQEPRR
ncbi:hypothetical protein CFD26_102591 [Aspergillus turcosus]|uniref:Uncharacterized protein n=1 Tax=Aspergillus turcosus TaxID=1245748 RepID=A0A3R7FN00_9EURO|nr:hypothetical protein CFD26_102591 [Aspergillus turcosus]